MTGIINVLKPPGMTSSDVVTVLRRVLNTKRVGHTGTLDPGAAGVLPICVGRATRLFDFLADKQKEYIAELTLGISTDTQDSYGSIINKSDIVPTADELKNILPRFCGTQMQTTPAYSAVKINGVASYKLARKNEAVELKARSIEADIVYLQQTGPASYLLKITCTRGTYIRTICNDIGVALGCGGYMSFLLRTRSGNFTLDETVTIDELADKCGSEKSFLIPPDYALQHLPECRLAHTDRKKLIDGCPVDTNVTSDGKVRIYAGNEFIGIGTLYTNNVKLDILLAQDDGESYDYHIGV